MQTMRAHGKVTREAATIDEGIAAASSIAAASLAAAIHEGGSP